MPIYSVVSIKRTRGNKRTGKGSTGGAKENYYMKKCELF